MGHRRLGAHLTQGHLNDLADALEKQSVFQHGRGVLKGCHLVPLDGLRVRCEQGVISVEAAKAVAAEDDIPLKPNCETFVWRDENGRSQTTSSPEPIGGLFVCVGRAVTDANTVVLCDGKGRMEPARMDPDDPRSFVVRADVLPKGASYLPVLEVFPISDVVLTTQDRNVQVVDGGETPVTVRLPDSPHWGNWFRVVNDGQADVVVMGGKAKFVVARGGVAEFVVAPKAKQKKLTARSSAEERKAAKYKVRRGEWRLAWSIE